MGLVADARYRSLREPVLPTVYVPFRSTDAGGNLEPIGWGTFLVRTSVANPLSLASILRETVPRARSEFRVSNTRTQTALNQSHAVRERLLATLALFFAGAALLLAGVGLGGVLHYSVLRRRRDIGIRLALGSGASDIVRHVTGEVFATVLVGSIAGVVLGLALQSYIQSLLYAVTGHDPWMLALPGATMIVVAMLAALQPVISALRTDPVIALRSE